jgi:thymidylate synthase
MSEEFSSSTVSDTEFDIVDELKATADDLEKELKASGSKKITEKISYLKFLINELDDTLSGKYEALRRKRFITKKTG